MKERPILFSAPMVRAILAGTKTQTRRIAPISSLTIKPCRDNMVTWGVNFSKPLNGVLASHSGGKFSEDQALRIIASQFCPHGKPGDRLWVRERWRIGAWNEEDQQIAVDYIDGPDKRWEQVPLTPEGQELFDRLWAQSTDECRAMGIRPNADGNFRWNPGESPLRWRPSIHMPRWASRITLEITGVRVERLLDISETDAEAEGVTSDGRYDGLYVANNPIGAYQALWNEINGPFSWDANPWVWVIEFRRVET